MRLFGPGSFALQFHGMLMCTKHRVQRWTEPDISKVIR
jgi:hypothetical protein